MGLDTGTLPQMYAHDTTATLGAVQCTLAGSVGFGVGTLCAGEKTQEELQRLGDEIVSRYLVSVPLDAPGVCMDGRKCACRLDGSKPKIGPKCAGGSLQTAFAAAEATPDYYQDHMFNTGDALAIEREEYITSLLENAGLVVGGHTTASAQAAQFADGKTGCGAAEKHANALQRIASADPKVFQAAQDILGIEGELPKLKDLHEVERLNETYTAIDSLHVESEEIHGANVEVLEGSHGEVAVILNTVDGMTIDRDTLVDETGMQVFDIDLWYVEKLVDAMVSGRPDAVAMKPKLLFAATAYQIAVYAELCDGSHTIMNLTKVV